MEKASELTKIKGIGPGRIKHFARLGLFSLQDLVSFLPRSYLDYSKPVSVAQAEDGEPAAIEVKFIGTPKTFRAKSGLSITTVSIADETGNITAAWFNQPYIARSIPKEPGGYALGTVDKRTGARLLRAGFSKELPGIIPVYPLTSGLTQSVMRMAVRGALDLCLEGTQETLPEEIREQYGLIPLKKAIETVHFPKDTDELASARRRLAFEDAAVLTIVLEKLRQNKKSQKGIAFETSGILGEFLELLPFEPTPAQFSVMNEIALDMASPQPMSRLIQGDVGSGKTALALYAMFIAAKNGAQSVLMAPTEILAEQHFTLLKRFFGDRAAILKGHMSAPVKREVLRGIADGSIIAVTGTHALIEGKVEFSRLGLVITDEQHRFGVRQRAQIGKKAESPDTIIMSATPIPRTLSLILYGDLDISLVKGMPPGRKPVKTQLVPSEKRIAMYRYIEQRINKERTQAYVVCPMIEENEDLERVRSAETVFDELKANLSIHTALVHGKLKSAEKDAIMESFRSGAIDLLVSTTVIEVGVDVPNACTMVIESAERFGLAQLHQLRGRVGRGDKQSECWLLTESRSKTAISRLRLLCETNDGFKIAERDLETRGPGELIGMRQHGISEFGAAALASDIETLKQARDCARKLLSMSPEKSERLMEKAMLKYNSSLEDVVIN
ncbi:MAG: ATP-dependent DNA helicase RecG [Clostridia bacterium]|nr:ATP-dependent DNA helicase RecG [Clostridia bacterium]